jgi:hypothetical protein
VRRLAVALLVTVLPACGVSGLSFVQDDRLSITAPKDRAEVELPVTVRWEVEDFEGTFAVFVDRAPVPGGQTLEWLARDDEICETTPGCPDEQWFADRHVFHTAETEITLERLPDLDRTEQREMHEITVVLIDERGRRVGESAFGVQFEVDEGGR